MHRTNKRFMFWNDWMFESIRGLKRIINKPVKSGDNPIFDEAINYTSVIYDQEVKLSKMWFSTRKVSLMNHRGWGLGYATSSDGLTWKKPSLGIVEYQGSKENSLTDMVTEGSGLGYVYLDRHDASVERRYKMVYLAREGNETPAIEKTVLAVSADGIHWCKDKSPEVLPFKSDAFNVIMYDSFIKKYLVFSRPGYGDRRVAVSLSRDLKIWEGPYTVLEPEEIQTHFYYLLPWQYEGVYLGFLPVLKTDEYEIEHVSKMDGRVHAELCYSPNGIGWQRISPGEAWIPHGEPGEFDAGGVYPMAAIVVGDEVRIYYEGSLYQHGVDRENCSRLGVAILRRDGFISLNAGEEEGSVTSRIIASWEHVEERIRKQQCGAQWINFKKGELRVHVKTEENGHLKTELLDEHWNVIKGYGRRESIPVTGDHFDATIHWKGKTTIRPLSSLFRVRLLVKNAQLYSFRFS